MKFKVYKHGNGKRTILNIEKIILVDENPENKDDLIIHLEGDNRIHVPNDEQSVSEINNLLGFTTPS